MSFSVDMSALVLGGLTATRTLSFLMAVPILGVKSVPAAVKIALAVWLAVALLPAVRAAGAVAPSTPGSMALAMSMEIMVGMLLAFSVVLIFAAVQYAGQIVGIQIGFSLVNVIDPQTESQVSIISQVYNILAVLLFLAIDGPLMVLRGLNASFEALVPGHFVLSQFGLYELVVGFGALFTLALRIALPVVLTLLLVSVAMGIVGRTVPQLNILVLGFPLKILVGSIVLAASIPFFAQFVLDLLHHIPEDFAITAWSLGQGR